MWRTFRKDLIYLHCSVAEPDPFHFGQPDPDPDPGSKKSDKIMENFHKNQPKS